MKAKVSVLVLCLSLAACMPSQLNSPEERDYFTGFEGVNADYTRNTPPSIIYYRGKPVNFSIGVRVRNNGASLTKGGIYISGYDPKVIDIAEIDEDRSFFNNCKINIDGIGRGSFDGYLQCRKIPIDGVAGSVGVSFNDAGSLIQIDNLNLGEGLDNLFDTDFFTRNGFNETTVSMQVGGDGTRFDIKFDNPKYDPAIDDAGAYFMKMWESMDFTMNQGKQYALKGDTRRWPGGEEDIIEYTATVKNLTRGVEKTEQPLMVTSCYLYSTFAAPTMCVDADPYSQAEKACSPAPYKSRRGQGGPVAVTSVTQRAAGNDIVFRIIVENLGRGTVYDPTRIQSCAPNYPLPTTDEDVNTVVLGVAELAGERLECEPDPYKIKLYDGRGVINCVYSLTDEEGDRKFISDTGYETPLLLELWYGYSETERKNVEIRRI